MHLLLTRLMVEAALQLQTHCLLCLSNGGSDINKDINCVSLNSIAILETSAPKDIHFQKAFRAVQSFAQYSMPK